MVSGDAVSVLTKWAGPGGSPSPQSELVSMAKNREHGLRSDSVPCAGPDPCHVISSDSITSQ